jgi:hypothetical protein
MGRAIKWRKMGEAAAQRGLRDTACPYAVGGIAFKNWIEAWKNERRRMARYLWDQRRFMRNPPPPPGDKG